MDVDATQLSEGAVATIRNNGTLGGVFEARGDDAAKPAIATVGGTKAIRFDGGDYLQLAGMPREGPPILPPRAWWVRNEPHHQCPGR